MKILIAGASGLVGTDLCRYLTERKNSVLSLVRDSSKVDARHFLWDPAKGEIDPEAFDGVDALINLSGENIADKRWTQEVKKHILDSRLQATRTLASFLARCKTPPRVYIQASAFGFYGDCKDRLCRESDPQGEGFLPNVCAQWEAAAKPIADRGIRTVIFRFGIVLSQKGGILAKILPLFRLSLGGKLGQGDQYMSWIVLDDLLSAILFALTRPSVEGVINLVSPHPVTNADFTGSLARALHRSAHLSIPAWALRLVLGRQMADELLLSSTRVDSSRLESFGYRFLYPDLERGLSHILQNR